MKTIKKIKKSFDSIKSLRVKLSFSSQVALLTLVYFFTGKFGLDLAAVEGFAAPFWIPTAISLTALYLRGYRLWPGVFLGALFVNLISGAPFFAAVAIGIGNTLEAVVAVALLRRLGFDRSLERVRDVSALMLIAGPVGAFISATIGIVSLWMVNIVLPSEFGSVWMTWWIGNMLSDMIIAPFLLVWTTKLVWDTRNRVAEGVALTFILLLFSFFIFTRPVGSPPLAYIIFPPLLWAALRFNARFVISEIFVISLLAIWTTSNQVGPFLRGDLSESLFYLQLYMAVVSVSSFIFSAVISERNELEKRKDDFLSMASHELKTPVTSMKIYMEILQRHLKDSKDERVTKVAANIVGQTERLKELVSDLLDVSRIEAGKLQFHMEKFSIDDVINEVKEGLVGSTDKHKIVNGNKSDITIYADKYRIYQVLTNLLTNAIKYSPKGGKIVVDVKEEKKQVIVSVKDKGIGISENQRNRVFDRLYQGGETDEKTYPGLGMGLFISKEIIKRHGGEIWVESKKSKGSTFYFSIPKGIQKIKRITK